MSTNTWPLCDKALANKWTLLCDSQERRDPEKERRGEKEAERRGEREGRGRGLSNLHQEVIM